MSIRYGMKTALQVATLAVTSLFVGNAFTSTLSTMAPSHVDSQQSVAQAVTPHNLALARSAEKQVEKTLYYDPSYTSLDYPGGDVPIIRGVCSDVVVRALREQGNDLQQLLHQDMKSNFAAYPHLWQLKKPDVNIDQRRVPNLEFYFQRHKMSQPITQLAKDYLPGDIVSWRLDNGLAHIGIVSSKRSPTGTPLVVHNIGAGAQIEDVLSSWKIKGHYRYFTH